MMEEHACCVSQHALTAIILSGGYQLQPVADSHPLSLWCDVPHHHTLMLFAAYNHELCRCIDGFPHHHTLLLFVIFASTMKVWRIELDLSAEAWYGAWF
jgi:hypothetical protein